MPRIFCVEKSTQINRFPVSQRMKLLVLACSELLKHLQKRKHAILEAVTEIRANERNTHHNPNPIAPPTLHRMKQQQTSTQTIRQASVVCAHISYHTIFESVAFSMTVVLERTKETSIEPFERTAAAICFSYSLLRKVEPRSIKSSEHDLLSRIASTNPGIGSDVSQSTE